MKILTKLVLAFTVMMILLGCASIIRINIGSSTTTDQKVDEFNLGQEYKTDITDESYKKRK